MLELGVFGYIIIYFLNFLIAPQVLVFKVTILPINVILYEFFWKILVIVSSLIT